MTDHQRPLSSFLARNEDHLTVLPVVARAEGATPEAVADMLANPAAAPRFLADVASVASGPGFAGLCFDLHGLEPRVLQDMAALVARAQPLIARTGGTTCVIAGLSDPIEALGDLRTSADRIILLGFDQPGPVATAPAPQDRLGARIAAARAQIAPDRLVIGLGTQSHAWTAGQAAPDQIAFSEAMRRVSDNKGAITLPAPAVNSRATYSDDAGRAVTVWMQDAVSAHNQLVLLGDTGAARLAVWPLGFEDPGLWPLLRARGQPGADAALALREMRLDFYVAHDGDGPFRVVLAPPETGERALQVAPETGLIVAQTYTTVPRPLTILRSGRAPGKVLALTFDDGPDAVYTDQVLDILADKDVPAAFFVLGSTTQRAPDTLERINAEGHEIGSHSYYHPYFDEITDTRLILEQNALQRLLISITGRGTTLFRLPYSRGVNPVTLKDARPLRMVDAAGYTTVAVEIAPPDWKGLSPAEVVDFVADATVAGTGQVVLLHDGGGDRSATVAALPLLIDRMRSEGYEFVTLAHMMGTTRDALMPPQTGGRVWFDRASFGTLASVEVALRWTFWIAIHVGIVRSLMYLFLAHLRRPARSPTDDFTPDLTVIVPAFNEEVSIVACVRGVLASDYPDLSVIVMDDGSTDHTFDLVRDTFRDDPRVRVLHQANKGKWMALDRAYGHVHTELVVSVDADTLVRPDAIRHLVQKLRDPAVGAVAGVVKVANRVNFLTRFQALEYITTQNIIRRAADVYNGQLVVPGAIGAWRVAAVRKAGLYSGDTLAEDADLTISVQRAGYRVAFEERAVAETEAPASVRPFLRQRLRWVLGMLQTGWKHRRTIREGRSVGLISITDFLVVGSLNQLLAPVVDLVMLLVLVDVGLNLAQAQPILPEAMSAAFIAGYLVLPVLDC